jgi:hypothetical protein
MQMFLAGSRLSYLTHRQALQCFSDTNQVSIPKNNKMNLPVLQQFLPATSE